MKIEKTNAVRMLDKGHAHYSLVPYECDESDLSAARVASMLGKDVERVFKTLVLRGDRTGIFVCVVPGDSEVDLKAAARVSGNKSAAMVHLKELFPLTGYIRGGCSPVGMKKRYPTYIHSSCTDFDYIYVSAGKRGLQMKIAPQTLIEFTGAVVAGLIAG